jgi:PAS domain S-box-containing protein
VRRRDDRCRFGALKLCHSGTIMNELARFFTDTGLPPHGFCLLWDPALIWLHAVSDVVICISYYAIPIALGAVVYNRRDFAFSWLFWLFAIFITACGTTHLMDVIVLWYPYYGLQGLLKAFTAGVSLLTAVLLWPLVPRLVNFPTPVQLQRVSELLSSESAERRRAVERLEQTEATFRRLVDGVRDYAIFMLDRGGHVSSWNSGAARIKGYTAAEAIGLHFSQFYGEEDRAAGLPQRALEVATKAGKFEAEGWRVRKDGSRFWASVVIDALYDDDGNLIGFAKITRDVTERRQTEQALEQTRAALAQSQKMEAVGQLTGGIAHDFNNLLAAILGSLELLERELTQLSARAHRYVSVMRHAAERGANLTSRLLAFSRKQALAPQQTDLNKLVRNMSELLRSSLGDHIEIETVLAGGLWQTFIDQSQMESSLLNLAVNARDVMPDGGKLTIETGNSYLDPEYAASYNDVEAGPYVLVAVSDTGPGMTPEVMSRAFEPFYTTKEQGKGTGLGLSQVFGFVKQSGGHVKLYSEPGHGTTVKIYLPRHLLGADRQPDAPDRQAVALPSGGETILVVEDDADVRFYSTSALRQLGYHVIEAADPYAALDMLRADPDVHMLFTDIGLPGINGRVLANEARKLSPHLKVLFTTAYTRNAVVHHGLLDSGVALLPKPFTMERLAAMCRHVLEKNAA